MSSRHRRLQIHTLTFSRRTTLSVQTALRVFAFFALPRRSLSHYVSPTRYQQDSDTGDQHRRHVASQQTSASDSTAWISCSGSFCPRTLSYFFFARRASDNAMATACLRLVTFLPDDDFSVPRLYSPITFCTLVFFIVPPLYMHQHNLTRAARQAPLQVPVTAPLSQTCRSCRRCRIARCVSR